MRQRDGGALLACGWLGIALGAIVLIGWRLSIPQVTRIAPGLCAMQPVTALCFVLMGMALLALRRRAYRTTLACVVPVFALASQALLEIAFGIDIAARQVASAVGGLVDVPEARPMGVAAAAGLPLLATSIVSLAKHRQTRLGLALGLVLAVLALAGSSWMALVYLTSVLICGQLWTFSHTALHTALGLTVMSAGAAFNAVLQPRLRVHARDLHRSKLGVPPTRAAWLVLSSSLVLTFVAWVATSLLIARDARAWLDAQAQELEHGISMRMHSSEQILLGLRGLFTSSDAVTRAEWHSYIGTQELRQRFPGVLGLGFGPRVTSEEVSRHEASVRAEGLPSYTVDAAHGATEYYPVTFIEPTSAAAQRMLGVDLGFHPERREAIVRALETGESVLTAPVGLVPTDDDREHVGVVMYLAIYRPGSLATTPKTRRSAVIGLVYAAFRIETLMHIVLEKQHESLSLQIHDESDESRELVYDDTALPGEAATSRPMLEIQRALVVGGRTWALHIATRPSFNATLPYQQPVTVLFAGVTLSLLLFGTAWSLSSTRTRAMRMAKKLVVRTRESERKYRDIVARSHGLIWMHDMDGKLLYLNPSACDMLGYASHELVGHDIREFMTKRGQEAIPAYLEQIRDHGRHRGTMALVTREGETRLCQYDNAYQESRRHGGYVVGSAQDVTPLREAQRALATANETLRKLAPHDSLTGLANRHLLYEHLAQAIEQSHRTGALIAVLFVDIDGFKQVNDLLGHAVGDELLQRIAVVLRQCCRASDVPARLGGDELVVMLTNISTPAVVDMVAERIADGIARLELDPCTSLCVSASIGSALFPRDGSDPESLVRCADERMYCAKRRGLSAAESGGEME